MGVLVWLLVALAGVCLHGAALHGLRALRQRNRLHTLMAALSLAMATYVTGLSVSLLASTPETFIPAVRVGAFGLLAAAALLGLAIRAFAGGRGRLPQLLVLAAFAIALGELALPQGLLRLGSVPMTAFTLPWGETVSFLAHTRSPGHWLIHALLLMAVLSGLHDLHRAEALARPGTRTARHTLWYVLFLLLVIGLGRWVGLVGMTLALAPLFVLTTLGLTYSIHSHERRALADRDERTAQRLRRLDTLLKLSSWRPPEGATESAAVVELATAARELLGVDRVSFWRLEGDTRLRTLLVQDARGGEHERALLFDTKDCAHYIEQLHTQSLIVSEDARQDERLSETDSPYLEAQGIRASLDLAIRSSGRMIGLFCIEHLARRPWSEDDVDFANSLAVLAGARWAAIRQARSSRALASLAGAVASGDDFLAITVRETARLFNADIALIALAEPDGQHAHSLALWADGALAETPLRYALPGSPCAQVLGGDHCIFPFGVATRFPEDTLLAEMGAEGYIGARFTCHTGAGLVVALRRKPLVPDEDTAAAIQIIAQRVAAELDRRSNEESMRQLAYVDRLTELPSRIALADAIHQRMAECREQGGAAALLVIDIDHFQTLNDVLGHDVGDEVLWQMARNLEHERRAGEFPARLAGDEFALLLPVTPAQGEEALLERANALRRAFETPQTAGERQISLGTSVGVTCFDVSTGNASDVVRRAEMALHHAKQTGRGRAALYHEALEQASTRRLALNEALRHALERGEMALHVQPKVDAHGQPVGAETLLRWTHPELGPISPAEFIPTAESTGLIVPLGQWGLRETCRLLARLPAWALATPGFTLAVNLSAWQLARPDIVGEIIATVRAENAQPAQLSLEITESIELHDLDEAIAKLKALRSVGFQISLDDFGTGYSSLAYLHRLPLDELKIDRSFVTDALAHPQTSLLQPVIALGRHRGLRVVAEGVERSEQAAQLAAIGCDLFQGYAFARPLPVGDFLAWMAERAPSARAAASSASRS